MKKSEKILAGAVGGIVLIIGLGFGAKALISKPLKEYDKRISLVREKINKAAKERQAFFNAEDQVKALSLRTFADTVDESSALSGEMLTRLITMNGLEEANFTRTPAPVRKLRGATEIGWTIQGDGALASMVNLIYMLQESPYISKVDGLSISAGDAPGLVRARFKYLTLVMSPAPDITRKPLDPKVSLETPERKNLEYIVARDILRPYVKRPPPPPTPPPGKGSPGNPGTQPPNPNAPPPPESLRVVSLSEWLGEPEVHIRDQVKNTTTSYKPGDTIAGGKVVMVDYRPMPMPGNEILQSFSRVILQIGEEYFAVERGKTLAEKRKLPPDQLPPSLAKAK